MFNPFEAFIGLRYVRARRRNHFISFISLVSMLGIAVGVLALITVLSVMNGFQQELTGRILAMATHADVIHEDGAIDDWRAAAGVLNRQDGIVGAAPYFRAEGMLVHEHRVHGVVLRGIDPDAETTVSLVAEKMESGEFSALKPGAYGMIIGSEAARKLGVMPGDTITLVAPQAGAGAAGFLPRLKRFTVAGIFSAGMHEFDSGLALVHLEDALALFGRAGPAGLRLKTADVMQAPRISREAVQALPGQYEVMDWTGRHAVFFRALKTEKRVMTLILLLIIAVAAFNVIATLMMVVTDKQADIAVLRTLGAGSRNIMKIFIIQGTVIGLAGILLGVLGGVWLAENINAITTAVEQFLNIRFLSPDVYYISELPSDLRWQDVAVTATLAFLLAVAGTIYPAWRAAQVQPATVLRYE
ncbi:MAG: lipoprotein-releasing ABC transporter permease subunit [Gammaproteobacteria bacterium]|nr:lipoprotein-releasing ABC transporter permease subunit [Gammaproteobacteria bacterium]MDE0285101.1 lipoprotein-releasing ABC transporter permease subunit [Gammaproteobacteria bacterium]